MPKQKKKNSRPARRNDVVTASAKNEDKTKDTNPTPESELNNPADESQDIQDYEEDPGTKITFEQSVYGVMDQNNIQPLPESPSHSPTHNDQEYEEPDESEFISDHVNVIPPSRPVSMVAPSVQNQDKEATGSQKESSKDIGQEDDPVKKSIEDPKSDDDAEIGDRETTGEDRKSNSNDVSSFENTTVETETVAKGKEADEEPEIEKVIDLAEKPGKHQEQVVNAPEELSEYESQKENKTSVQNHEAEPRPSSPSIRIDTSAKAINTEPEQETPDYYGEEMETPIVQHAVSMEIGKGLGIGSDSMRKTSASSQASESSLASNDSQNSNGMGKRQNSVSKLVSNFESHIQEEQQPPKSFSKRSTAGDEKFSRSRARMIGQSLMNGVTSPPTSPKLDDDDSATAAQTITTTSSPSSSASSSVSGATTSTSGNGLPKSKSMPLNRQPSQNRRKMTGGHLRKLSLSSKQEEEKKGPLRGLSFPHTTEDVNSIAGKLKNFTLGHASIGGGGQNKDLEQEQLQEREEEDQTTPTATRAPEDLYRTKSGVDPLAEENGSPKQMDKSVVEPSSPPSITAIPPVPESAVMDDNESNATDTSLADQLKQEMQQDMKTPPLGSEDDGSISESVPQQKRELSVNLKPIEIEDTIEEEDEEGIIFGVCVVGFHHHRYVLNISLEETVKQKLLTRITEVRKSNTG